MLPYETLLAMLPKLRFKDDTALRTIGLAPLAKSFDAYPVQESGNKCYFLLPKGAEIPNARKLTPMTATAQIIILKEGQKGFAKVWPNKDSANAASTPAVQAAPPPAAEAPKAAAKAEAKSNEPLGSLEFVDE